MKAASHPARRPLAERSASVRTTVVILIDLDAAPQPTPEALQKIFALTHAEAKLAMEIARGKSPTKLQKPLASWWGQSASNWRRCSPRPTRTAKP